MLWLQHLSQLVVRLIAPQLRTTSHITVYCHTTNTAQGKIRRFFDTQHCKPARVQWDCCKQVQWFERKCSLPASIASGMHDVEVVESDLVDTNLVGCLDSKALIVTANSYEEVREQRTLDGRMEHPCRHITMDIQSWAVGRACCKQSAVHGGVSNSMVESSDERSLRRPAVDAAGCCPGASRPQR